VTGPLGTPIEGSQVYRLRSLGIRASDPSEVVHIMPLYAAFAAVLTYLHILFSTVSPNRQRGPGALLLGPSLCLLAYAVVTLAWSPNLEVSIASIFLLACNVLAYLLIAGSVRSDQILRQVLWVFTWIGIVHALSVVASYLLKGPIDWIWPAEGPLRLDVALPGGMTDAASGSDWLRDAEFLSEYHMTFLMMNVHIAGAVALLFVEKKRARRLLLWSAIALMVAVGAATNVRGGMLGLLGMVAFLTWFVPRLRRKWWLVGGAAVVALILVVLAEGAVFSALRNREFGSRFLVGNTRKVGTTGTGSINTEVLSGSRFVYWSSAFRHLIQESWGAGIGTRNFPLYELREGSSTPHTHSIYVSIITDYGVVGIIIVLWAAGIVITHYRRALGAPGSERTLVAVALGGGLVAIGIHGLVDFHHNHPFFWCYLGLFSAALALAAREPVAPLGAAREPENAV